MAFIAIYDTSSTDKTQLNEYLENSGHELVYVEDNASKDNLRPETEAISVFVSSNITKEIIGLLPKLKLIACRSTGYNNVDLDAAKERGIAVVNVPTYGEHTVAEYTFGLILSLSRKLRAAAAAASAPGYSLDNLTGFDLDGKTLGIVGMGRIGQQVARIGKSFGMGVIAYDPFPVSEKASEIGFSYVDIQELAQKSDIISLHAPFTGDNKHVIDSNFFSELKRKPVFVNTSRGELVDTKALVEALRDARLAGAALDVLEGEKLLNIEDELVLIGRNNVPAALLEESLEIDILKRLPNVIITPHNAFNTVEAIGRINKTTAQNITGFFDGKITNQVGNDDKPKNIGRLVIVRHGESEWNARGEWTGSRDVHLSEKGFKESALLGQALADTHLDIAFASQQIRAFETLESILDASQQFDVPYERSAALNERDYGDYTGLNKWQVKEQLGEEIFQHIRRDWDYPVPNGETLKTVYNRAAAYYLEHILPKLKEGKTVLVVSHGNAIRALIKYIENISDEGIADVKMPFGDITFYNVDESGHMLKKDVRKIDTIPPPA